jgi:hypothetical protein
MRLLKFEYLTNHNEFEACDVIEDRYFHTWKYNTPTIFISHIWEGSKNPDPDKRQFHLIKTLITSQFSNYHIFYDFSCIPQNEMHSLMKLNKKISIKQINDLLGAKFTKLIVLNKRTSYKQFDFRTWCAFEWIVAQAKIIHQEEKNSLINDIMRYHDGDIFKNYIYMIANLSKLVGPVVIYSQMNILRSGNVIITMNLIIFICSLQVLIWEYNKIVEYLDSTEATNKMDEGLLKKHVRSHLVMSFLRKIEPLQIINLLLFKEIDFKIIMILLCVFATMYLQFMMFDYHLSIESHDFILHHLIMVLKVLAIPTMILKSLDYMNYFRFGLFN